MLEFTRVCYDLQGYTGVYNEFPVNIIQTLKKDLIKHESQHSNFSSSHSLFDQA